MFCFSSIYNMCYLFVKGRLKQKHQIQIVILCGIILCLLHYFEDSTVINTNCKLHNLNPWDKVLKKYLTYLPPVQCINKSSLMFVSYDGYLQFNSSVSTEFSMSSLKCVYHVIHRQGDNEVSYLAAVTFEPPVFVPDRIFRVICKLRSKVVYDFVHVNMAWNESQEIENNIGYETDEQLSVIYIGFDSVSRSEAIRKIPRSYNFLTKTMGAYDFAGMMKVGLNTYPNVIALLRGEYGKQLLLSSLLQNKFDDEPFLWKEAKQFNYVTSFIEDRPTESPFRGRFITPPTDYFYRPYAIAMDATDPIISEKLENTTSECYGNKDKFLLQLDYLKHFLYKYDRRRKFVFFFSNTLSHDTPNLERGDTYIFEFLTWMESKGHLDRSVLLFGSDHGFRIGGGASATYVGKLEMNMPVLIVYVPKHIKTKYPWMDRNLRQNTKHLVTHYDAYETMKGFMNSDFVGRDSPKSITRKGRKLYNEISVQRSCTEAGIPPNFCSCDDGASELDVSLPLVKLLGKRAIEKINELMVKYRHLCRPLGLINITEAKVSYKATGNDVIYGFREFRHWIFENDASGRYVIEFYTYPNDGQFQAVFDLENGQDKGTDNQITIMGDPVRLNKYGNQSHCVDNSHLKQFCLCTDIH